MHNQLKYFGGCGYRLLKRIMRPLMLHGHERAITQIRYNYEGDLLFSVAKDNKPTVWHSENGERLGTYNGHNGAVWCVDVSPNSSHLITGAGDNTAMLWDCETGKSLRTFTTNTPVRSCGFSNLGDLLMFTTDERKDVRCEVLVYDARADDSALARITVDGAKITAGLWGPFDEYIITGHEDGSLSQYDYRIEKQVATTKPHKGSVSDVQLSKDMTMIITASKDNSAKLFDVDTLDIVKSYPTERPVNSAAISPLKNHVVLGGGQEAMDVTTTTSKAGKFEARFFHMIFEEEIGRVKGHFGPINNLKFHPSGKSYSSGGEDGYVRVHSFDNDYFDFEMDY